MDLKEILQFQRHWRDEKGREEKREDERERINMKSDLDVVLECVENI